MNDLPMSEAHEAEINRLIRKHMDHFWLAALTGTPPLIPTIPVGSVEQTNTVDHAPDFAAWRKGCEWNTSLVDQMREMIKRIPPPKPEFKIVPADRQCRTPRDVPAGTRRTSPRPPAKADGRRGTRKAWKRRFPPRTVPIFTYREPEDVLILSGSAREPWRPDYMTPDRDFTMRYRSPPPDLWIVTPGQHDRIVKLVEEKGVHL